MVSSQYVPVGPKPFHLWYLEMLFIFSWLTLPPGHSLHPVMRITRRNQRRFRFCIRSCTPGHLANPRSRRMRCRYELNKALKAFYFSSCLSRNGLFARSLRYAKNYILGISAICLRLNFSQALISNKNPCFWMGTIYGGAYS